MSMLPPGVFAPYNPDEDFEDQLRARNPGVVAPAAVLTNSVFRGLEANDTAITEVATRVDTIEAHDAEVDLFGAYQLGVNDTVRQQREHHDRHLTHSQVVILVVTIVAAVLTVGLGFYFCVTDTFDGMEVNTDMARLITGVAIVGWGAVIVGELLTWYRPWRPANQHADAIEASAEETPAPVPGDGGHHPVPAPTP